MKKLMSVLIAFLITGLSFSTALVRSAEAFNEGKSHEIHNPAKDAKGCVDLAQSGPSNNWKFVNRCGTPVEVFWCFVQSDGSCRNGGTWSVRDGSSWSSQGNQPIKWGACKGKNSGGMDGDSNGERYTCREW